MIIRAIDPGPVKSAYVDWDGETIHNFGIIENRYFDTLETGPIEKAYFEMVACYGMPVGVDVFETAFWIGRFWEHYVDAGLECAKIYRKDVKMHLCGNTRAKDSNIIAAIVDRFDPHRRFGKYGKGTAKNPGPFYGFSKDVWAAMAVALTAYDCYVVAEHTNQDIAGVR